MANSGWVLPDSALPDSWSHWIGGTSASSPSMAGIIALVNQYQVANGFQAQAGLGNINPQLYRLAQSAPSVFHDITAGNNIVPCAQGTADCLTGSFGYSAGIGYDMVTGLGSVDANALVTQWNTATQGVVVTLSSNATTGTVNDTIQLTATVAPASGPGTPTGTVSFVFNGAALGSAPLVNGAASVAVPLAQLLATGNVPISAEYSGDAAFSSGGATLRIRVTVPTSAAAVWLSRPLPFRPSPTPPGRLGRPTSSWRKYPA
jgi:subtilase family serine protease